MPCAAASANNRRRASDWRVRASSTSAPAPERISISELISSPAIESASTASAAPASRSASNPGTSSSDCGSTSANSSSMPTVRSAEASNVSRAVARSITRDPSGQVEVERVEEVHGEDADDDVLLLHDLLEVLDVPHADAVDLLADLGPVGVEHRHHAEAVVGE